MAVRPERVAAVVELGEGEAEQVGRRAAAELFGDDGALLSFNAAFAAALRTVFRARS